MFLDAGGVLVFPNWRKISEALAVHGVAAPADALAAAEPRAKRRLDNAQTIRATTDLQRSFPYFNLVLDEAGVEQGPATEAALAELHAYHAAHNLWESVPPDVPPALQRLRQLGLQLVVVSNSNGTLHACFDRVGLTAYFHEVLDSHREGIEKPDRRLFDRALARAGARPESTVHVGDIFHVDVAGARNASIAPVLLDPWGLYGDADCARVASLAELADALARGAAFRRTGRESG